MKNAIFLLLSPVIILICGILLVAYYKRKNEILKRKIKKDSKQIRILREENEKLVEGNRKLRTENKNLRLEKNKLKFKSKI